MKLFALVLVLSAAVFAQDSGKIFAVRHAEKQSDDADTPLSAKGLARADCLAQTLKDAHINAVLVTQYKRTHQTAAPTMRESLAKEQQFDSKQSDQTVSAARGAAQLGNVLIVGHSNTLPDILKALGAGTVTIPDSDYDLLFVLDIHDPQHLVTLHYCPTLPQEQKAFTPNSMATPK
jgi:phosphohistidine phosphatase SixA